MIRHAHKQQPPPQKPVEPPKHALDALLLVLLEREVQSTIMSATPDLDPMFTVSASVAEASRRDQEDKLLKSCPNALIVPGLLPKGISWIDTPRSMPKRVLETNISRPLSTPAPDMLDELTWKRVLATHLVVEAQVTPPDSEEDPVLRATIREALVATLASHDALRVAILQGRIETPASLYGLLKGIIILQITATGDAPCGGDKIEDKGCFLQANFSNTTRTRDF